MSRSVACIIFFSLVAGAARPALAAGAREKDEADRAVARGLAFLNSQQKSNGQWEVGKRNAITGLCLLAFLANGHTPGENTYAPLCRKALDSLIGIIPDDGYMGNTDGSQMYGQGIVTLTLAECYGMERDARLRKKLKTKLDKMVEVILKAQAVQKGGGHQGGWRYHPNSHDSDLSLSGWCALALRSARNCGLDVPKSAVEKAADYVEGSFNQGEKTFSYQRNARANLATTGVGVLSLYLLGREDSNHLKLAVEYLFGKRENARPDKDWFFYTMYYSTQAANQVGGDVWKTIWEYNSRLLLSMQKADGSWDPDRQAADSGKPFSTSMAVLALSVRNHFLPSYQR